MTKQEIERLLSVLEAIAEMSDAICTHVNALCTHVTDIAGRLDDLYECIGETPNGSKYLRVVELNRE